MQHTQAILTRLHTRLAVSGCVVFAILLTGCGGGPDDAATIQALKDLGVLVVPNTEGQISGLNNLPTDPEKLTQAIELSSKLNMLKTVTAMAGVPITDEHLETLGKNRNLVYLSVDGAPITNDGIAKLTGLQNLENLTLIGTNVTSACMGSIGKLKKLNNLNLNDSKVDGGYEKLSSCPNLQWILVGGLEIKDEDAEAISKLPALTHVTYSNLTTISDTALKTLKSNSKCTVDSVTVAAPAATP